MESLHPVGFTIPSWEELILAENQNRVPVEEEDPSQPRSGRQQEVTVVVHHTFLERELRPLLGETEEALLRSQGGPLASVPFTSLPTMRETSLDPQPFRLLLLRRLRLPLPLSARWCQCGRPLDCLGHHQSACSRAGVLGHRGYPMETVSARICREAGARVRTNVMVRDLDLGAFNRLDGRRLEIIADGLPLWRGAQLAVAATLLSPIKADGTGTASPWRRRAEPKRGNTQSWPDVEEELVSWWSAPRWEVASLPRHPSFSAVLCLPRFGVCFRLLRGRLLRLGCAGGAQCWAAWSPTLLHCPSSVGSPWS